MLKPKLLFLIVNIFLFSHSQASTIRLVTFEYPPYEYTESGQLKGLAVNIVKRVFAEMDQAISIEVLPWARAIRYIQDGSRDGIFTAFKNENRECFAVYSKEVLVQQSISLFVRKDSQISYENNINNLKAYRLGVVRKYSYGPKFDDLIRTQAFLSVEATNDGKQNFGLLLNKRVDMVPSERNGAYQILQQLNRLDEVTELSYNLESVPSYIAFSKARNLIKLRDEFDQTLGQLKASGEYLELINDYFKNESSRSKNTED